ncbi:MAG TPA: DNA (cytosine-5-)-methyltransferase [Brevundimonas sp.]|nr:DNA (cytosine-5-)-methyltransferase [Brevundimonas sp.]
MIESRPDGRPGFYEFFCGGGMVRAGLGEGWRCLFANDIDPRKAASWQANWGPEALHVGDVAALAADDLPGRADLMWGSFPCQDLSWAGAGAGLGGRRSGTFHAFWSLARDLTAAGRAPRMVVVENVCGALTSRGGLDFQIICRTFVEAGYRCGALVINADRFLPQSRPRLFVLGVREDVETGQVAGQGPCEPFHPPALRRAVERLPAELRRAMMWWSLPAPAAAPARLEDVVEPDRPGLVWHDAARTAGLLALMSPTNLAKVEAVRRNGGSGVGAVFRRTRRASDGGKVQRAEVRFDRAGCLRTPAGGSSRQILLVVESGSIRTRLMTGRETARLMGLPDAYDLPASHGAACHLTGDGVAVPVVRSLAEHLFEPLAASPPARRQAA